MDSVLHKLITLKLNRNWLPIHTETPEVAFVDLSKGATKALDIQFFRAEDGAYDYANVEYMNPVSWEEWVSLPIRDCDFVIHTPRLSIRVPTIVICENYSHMPMKLAKFTRQGIWTRDKGICQYTGRKLSSSEGTIDHIVPQSKGGPSSWENCALADREVNFRKGNKSNKEAGLRLIKKPVSPIPQPVINFIRNKHDIPEWNIFLNKRK